MKWRMIVLHNTEADDSSLFESSKIKQWHLAKGWQDIGYHIVIEKVLGQVWGIFGRPLTKPGAHCYGYNSIAIGIALNGNFNKYPPSADQISVSVIIIKWLMDVYNISKQNIFCHRDLISTDCPGKYFDIRMILDQL